jgi:hypothetical protein
MWEHKTITMKYQSLICAWEKYPRKWDNSYNKSIESGIWNDPCSYIEEKVQFLNDWLCRVDQKTAIPDIEKPSAEFNDILQEISSLDLLSLTFRETEKPRQIYELLSKVNGLGPTGISKYLHMHKPKLFIMWDNQIFRDYFHVKTVLKSTATSKRYVKFMVRMRNEIREAIHDLASYRKITETQATIRLREYFNNESLPRILDKYNYVTRGQPKQLIY